MVQVLRVLCREDFSIQSAKMFVSDLKMALEWLDAHFIYTPEQVCTWRYICMSLLVMYIYTHIILTNFYGVAWDARVPTKDTQRLL